MQLSDMERERLEDMLRGLSVERAAVRAAMLFALEHAACAAEICDVLSASLTLAETPPHLKVARCAPAPLHALYARRAAACSVTAAHASRLRIVARRADQYSTALSVRVLL